ncbi:MAG TPA: IS66 family transposase [Acidiferrobacterales bacterium]|nr:IS66 family transposase [Acidiferrobacterales bacterium]
MTITSQLLEAYVKCSTKCWLRRAGENASGNAYAVWVQAKSEAYRADGIKRLVAEVPDGERVVASPTENLKTATWRIAIDLQARVQNFETWIPIVERAPSAGRGKAAQFIPIRFVWVNKIGRHDKLLLAFDALALSKILSRDVPVGKIIHGADHAVLKVKTSDLVNEVRTLIEKTAALLSSPSPPDLILNRHCAECEFQTRCRQKAVEKDDLSLLALMKEKERRKFHSKGIFTITQLSYTFRPRRRPKRQRDKREKYHHALKALAIREKKIHVVDSPELKIAGTTVYIDVEGLPDRDFYYLIGVRIGKGEAAVQHCLWANTVEDERTIWNELLGILGAVENPVLIHYGSYETVFLRRMCERYGEPLKGSVVAGAIRAAVNLLAMTFARVYFPTFSNGLKEIAGYLGFRWSDSAATGLQSIRWRHEWETATAPSTKQALITYNAQDCEAVGVLASKLIELHHASLQTGGSSLDGVVDTARMKREHPHGFKRNIFAFPEMDVINKAAYWDYQRERVYVKSNGNLMRAFDRTSRPKRALAPDTTIECLRPRSCPKCNSTEMFGHGKASKTVFDLRFMRHGVKRWISRYRFHRYKCLACGATFLPEQRGWTRSKYGSEIRAYALYQNIGLRLPQESVVGSLNKLFGLHLPVGSTSAFKQDASKAYEGSYNALVKSLCSGRLLHADETKVSVKGMTGFVWVFTNMEEVAYIYSETREGDLLQALLKDFTGVLVSDFYAAYDGIRCPQQKCLIHLIRDLNDDVLKNPYDEELKRLAQVFAGLVRPMVKTVDRHGLKSRFLKKHRVSVDRFYRQLSTMALQSQAAMKLRDRLQKNREKLFTFLSFDGVPWNNNNAEHAVKAFATLRKVIGGSSTEKGIREYLILLSICETCKYKGLDFLDFLRSGKKNIDAFASIPRGGYREPFI